MNLQQKNFRAILFDMDGVIIDTKEQVEAFWFEKMKEHGVKIDDEYLETSLHGRPARFIIKELFPHLDNDAQLRMDQECTDYDSLYSSYAIVPGVEVFIQALLNNDITIGLVTSALPPKVDVMLKSLSLKNPFKEIVTANQVKKGKPDPECYLLGADKLGFNIKDILVFEDSVSGTQAASRAGATVFGVNEPEIAPMLLKAGADHTIRNFTEIDLGDENSMFQFTVAGNLFSINSVA